MSISGGLLAAGVLLKLRPMWLSATGNNETKMQCILSGSGSALAYLLLNHSEFSWKVAFVPRCFRRTFLSHQF